MAVNEERDRPLCVDSIYLAASEKCSATDCNSSHIVCNVDFSPEELYKYALQFCKGRSPIAYMS